MRIVELLDESGLCEKSTGKLLWKNVRQEKMLLVKWNFGDSYKTKESDGRNWHL